MGLLDLEENNFNKKKPQHNKPIKSKKSRKNTKSKKAKKAKLINKKKAHKK
jgi:hypothetical protein